MDGKNCTGKHNVYLKDTYASEKEVDILISKNQALQILYLKHYNNEYITS